MTSEQNGEGVQEIAKFADKQYIFCGHREGVVKKNKHCGNSYMEAPLPLCLLRKSDYFGRLVLWETFAG